MNRIHQLLEPLLRRALNRPLAVLLVAAVFTAAGGYFASRLRIDTDLVRLLPPSYPSVKAIERLRETVGGETFAAVIIESPDPAASHAFARALIPRLQALRQRTGEPFFTGVDYRREVGFLERNGLYLATGAELDTIESFLERRIERARLEANPMLLDLLEEDAGGKGEPDHEIAALRRRLLPTEYPVSEDGRTLVLRVRLAGAKTDIGYVDEAYRAMGRAVAALDRRSFNPGLSVELGGPLLRHQTEVHALDKDVFQSVGAGMIGVLLLVTGYFFVKACRVRAGTAPWQRIVLSELVRTPVVALVVGLPLLMSLAWTFGLARLRFGSLNLMTSTLALVLFGLGIEFGIHVFARYLEERGRGLAAREAMDRTLAASLAPIAITASTTIASFALLTVADFRGFSQFGFIAALGLFFALLATVVVLPALVLLLEQSGLLKLHAAGPALSFAGAPGRMPFARTVVLVCAGAFAVSLVMLPRFRFEWNFDLLEPAFPAYERIRDKYQLVYPPGERNPAYVLAETPEEVPAIVAAVRERAATDTATPTIGSVESLQDRFPLEPEAQAAKIERIARIRRLLANRYLRGAASEDLEALRTATQINRPIRLAELPESLRRDFTTRDGRIGNFVLIYPAVELSDGRASIRFAEDVSEIKTADGRVYQAASTSIVAADMLRLLMRESPLIILLTIGSLVLLVPLAFRSLRLAALGLLPLVVGVVWMLAMMESWKVSLNFYNMVVLPTVLGMGEDAGVHLTHRWVEEGPGRVLPVMRSTGQAVTLCQITGMMGFGGMVASFHPGLRSMGWMAVIGLGTTLVASLLFLPALLQVVEDRRARRAVAGAATTSR